MNARQTDLAIAFDQARPRLTRLAYATTGSFADAEDIVSDCWIKLMEADQHAAISDVEGWATVAVARLALDVARSARNRRVSYVGPWLPEPTIVAEGDGVMDPAHRVLLDEHVSYALLVLLESLTPAERTAWVLHDLFGAPFSEVAVTVGRTPAAVRQLASRARSRVRAHASRITVTAEQHEHTVRQFRDAAEGGDIEALLRILDPNVVIVSDGGGEVRAARRPVRGIDAVARFVCVIWSRFARPGSLRLIDINGQTAMGRYDADQLTAAITFIIDAERIQAIHVVKAPAKLTRRTVVVVADTAPLSSRTTPPMP